VPGQWIRHQRRQRTSRRYHVNGVFAPHGSSQLYTYLIYRLFVSTILYYQFYRISSHLFVATFLPILRIFASSSMVVVY